MPSHKSESQWDSNHDKNEADHQPIEKILQFWEFNERFRAILDDLSFMACVDYKPDDPAGVFDNRTAQQKLLVADFYTLLHRVGSISTFESV